jgi:phosphoribosylaminoimidazole carboxylase PurE protein
VKAAAVSDRLRTDAQEVLVHTGQHYDDELSRVFFDELRLPRPDHQLDVGGGTNTSQTSRMLAALEPLITGERPDVLLVYGDTNSTMAGALAGAQAGVPVAHVEAGMRSYDRTMPEELNRVLTDHASDLLLCSSEAPAEILRGERVAGTIAVVGDVMVDVAELLGPRAAARTEVLARFGVPHELRVLSAHRTPDAMAAYGREAHTRGLRVIIAGAGGAAHLPGMLAAHSPLPVIGVPVQGAALNGLDSLLSIVQMPRGVPVATVAIGGGANAGLLAVEILATADPALRDELLAYKRELAETARQQDAELRPTD